MTIASLNHLNPVPEPPGDDVDGLPGTDSLAGEGPTHVVDGASDPARPHVCTKGLVEVVAVRRTSLLLIGSNGVATWVPISQKTSQKVKELFC